MIESRPVNEAAATALRRAIKDNPDISLDQGLSTTAEALLENAQLPSSQGKWQSARRLGGFIRALAYFQDLGVESRNDMLTLLANRTLPPEIVERLMDQGSLITRTAHEVIRASYPELVSASQRVVATMPNHIRTARGWGEVGESAD